MEKLPKSRRYRLCPQGYSICLLFLKLFERVYSPLTAGLLQPYHAAAFSQAEKVLIADPAKNRKARNSNTRQVYLAMEVNDQQVSEQSHLQRF